jgi:hypothetical protein
MFPLDISTIPKQFASVKRPGLIVLDGNE